MHERSVRCLLFWKINFLLSSYCILVYTWKNVTWQGPSSATVLYKVKKERRGDETHENKKGLFVEAEKGPWRLMQNCFSKYHFCLLCWFYSSSSVCPKKKWSSSAGCCFGYVLSVYSTDNEISLCISDRPIYNLQYLCNHGVVHTNFFFFRSNSKGKEKQETNLKKVVKDHHVLDF